jgi:hypothetical protein
MKAEQTRCPQEATSVSDGVPRSATDPRSHRGNARPSDRLGRRLGGQSNPSPPRPGARNAALPSCWACGQADGSYSGRIKCSSRPVPRYP